MSNVENYETLLETIQSIAQQDIKMPNSVPVDVYLQEAENLFHWCREDKEELIKKGLDAGFIEQLPVRCGALREAQSRWIISRFSRQEAEKEWAERSPEAYDFRNELLHTFRFAYRNDPAVLGRVSTIAEGNSHADMIQDLNDLSVLGRDFPEGLESINFDLSLLDRAADLADEMSNLLGAATNECSESSKEITIRNQAFTYLKEAVDEVRAYGQFVFWRDEHRVRGYASAYVRRVNRNAKNSSDEQKDPVTA